MLVLGESHIHQMAQINVNLTLTSPTSTVAWNTFVQVGNAAMNVDGKNMVNPNKNYRQLTSRQRHHHTYTDCL